MLAGPAPTSARGEGIAALRRAHSRSWRAELGPASPVVDVTGSWEQYWSSRRTSFRRELERKERGAARQGLRVGIAFDPQDVDKLLPDVTEVYDVAEAARPMNNFLAGVKRSFTIDMLRGAAEQSRLALFVLYLGVTPVATSFTYRTGAVLGGGGLRFDPAFGRFSPGQLLFCHILGHAFESDCTEFDFGPRDAPYKRAWSTAVYNTVEITAFSSGTVRALHLGTTAASARLVRKAG